MKIIAWNCNMAFRKKLPVILQLKPDILVIPECEHPDKFTYSRKKHRPTDFLWIGSNPHKGLGILSFGAYKLRQLDCHNPKLKWVLPVAVTGGEHPFTLLGIWANHPEDPDGTYVAQVWKAIHHYEPQLANNPCVLAGDFNSNTIWDRKRRVSNHSNVVAKLGDWGIVSTYHLQHGQTQGKEKHPTQYMYRHRDKPYHLDYCFVSKELASRIEAVEIGKFKRWTKYSDHVPVTISFRQPLNEQIPI